PYFLFTFIFFKHAATAYIYTLSLHDALPIYRRQCREPRARDAGREGREDAHRDGRIRQDERTGALCDRRRVRAALAGAQGDARRSEEHTSELQSRENLVCRLLLEKKKSGRQR